MTVFAPPPIIRTVPPSRRAIKPMIFIVMAASMMACSRAPESTVLSPGQQNALDRANQMESQLQQQADERAKQMRDHGM